MDIRFMQVEPIGGHQGHRYINSFDIIAKNPATGQVRSFVVKAQEDLERGEKPEEIEAAIAVRLARVHSEKPVAYWRDSEGHQYAVFEMLRGRTMLLAETTDFNSFLKACKEFGRLFKAELFHADTGLKHVFVQEGVPHLFDFESLHLERRKELRENDFGFFLAESVAHGWVKDWNQFQKSVIAYVDATGVPRGKGYREHRMHWLNSMRHFLQDQLLLENEAFRISRTRDERENFSIRIKRLKQMLDWLEHPKRTTLSYNIRTIREKYKKWRLK
jgi:hypothetical protein